MMRFNKWWRRFSLLAALGFLLATLWSCGGSTKTNASGKPEVEFWTMQLQPKFTAYFERIITEFEAKNPDITINWVDVPWEAMQNKILAAVQSNTAPDVVNLNPDFASQLAGRDAWLPLDDQITPENRGQYLPNIWNASTLDGKSFGFPWYLTSRIAIYNQDLFKAAGIDTPPKTFEELATAAKEIKEKTGKYAFFVSAVPTDSGELMESMVQMGVKLVDAQGKAAFNSPEGKKAFTYWSDLFKQDLIPREVLTEGHRRGIDLYQSGEIALLTSSPQFLGNIATNAPDIANVSAPAPQITGSTGKINVAVMNLVIPKDTDQPDAALKFAQFVTNPANQLEFAKEANVIPSTQESLTDPYFSEVPADAKPEDKGRIVSAQQMNQAEVLIPTLKDIKQLQQILYENLQATMLDQKSVDQALTDAEQAWNQSQA
jgi:putative chitobiose transport system substrate-binding protein